MDRTTGPPTLFTWAGGAALRRLTETFYTEVSADDLLGPLFRGMDEHHPAYVAEWLGEVSSGPPLYSEQRGGYPHMLSQHLGRSLTESQRRRWVSLLTDAADTLGLPDDPEFRSAFAAYIEWGTRLAVANSARGAQAPADAPMPRWGWGEAPPYEPAPSGPVS